MFGGVVVSQKRDKASRLLPLRLLCEAVPAWPLLAACWLADCLLPRELFIFELAGTPKETTPPNLLFVWLR